MNTFGSSNAYVICMCLRGEENLPVRDGCATLFEATDIDHRHRATSRVKSAHFFLANGLLFVCDRNRDDSLGIG